MKELELLHDRNFREKVRLVEGHVSTMPPLAAASVRATMMSSWTREQFITYHVAVADDEAARLGYDHYERAQHLERSIELAALEYDVAQ